MLKYKSKKEINAVDNSFNTIKFIRDSQSGKYFFPNKKLRKKIVKLEPIEKYKEVFGMGNMLLIVHSDISSKMNQILEKQPPVFVNS